MVYIQNDQIQSNVPSAWYSSLENFIVKGKNAEIWDSEGNRFLDYVGGYAVLILAISILGLLIKSKISLIIFHTLVLLLHHMKMQ